MARPDASERGRREAAVMLQTPIETPDSIRAENGRLRDQLERLRAENARLRGANRDLRATLDAHIRRAGLSALYGPLELTAGTCVGPRRRRRVTPGGVRHA
jgi:hypothetical protein